MRVILATRQDVEKRLDRQLESSELDGVDSLIEEASVTVEEYLGVTYTEDDEIPDAVVIVVSRMVARRVNASGTDTVPDGVNSLGATDYQASFAEPFVSMGVWLNRFDKMMLRRYRVSAVSVPLQSERY